MARGTGCVCRVCFKNRKFSMESYEFMIALLMLFCILKCYIARLFTFVDSSSFAKYISTLTFNNRHFADAN